MIPGEIQTIKVDKVTISEWNVRISDKDKGIEELAENIQKYGLLQPITVYREGDKFRLIVGQRRLRALKELIKNGHSQFSDIKAIVLSKKPDEEESKILSLSENIHRVELNREDIVRVITYLYEKCNKSVRKVSKILGKQPGYIYDYLKIDTAPQEVKEMYYRKELTKADVKRIMELAPKNKEEMISFAKEFAELTPLERKRAVELRRRNPQAKTDEIRKQLKIPFIEETILVPLSLHLRKALDNASKEIGLSREEVAQKALEDWLSDKGYYKEIIVSKG